MVETSLDPKPAVVFVDDERWYSFLQLAAILQRAGLRTVRISVGPSMWRPENLLFSRNVFLAESPSPEQLAEILANENVVDVQPTERLAKTSYSALDLLPQPQRSNIWAGRLAILDKQNNETLFREIGLRSPESLPVGTTPENEAVARLSLPIVLKRRIGSSGSGVKVFTSLEDLREYVAAIESPDEWLYEQFIQGRSFVYAACVSDEGIDVMATYKVLEREHLSGPSSVMEFQTDPHLVESGRILINALHIRGLICFDIIRDSNDVDWIHDVNPRVFGGLTTCQLAGFDFRGAYLRCLGVDVDVQSSPLDTPTTISFGFPEGGRELLRSAPYRVSWVRALRWIWSHWRLLGSRYFLAFVIDRPVTAWRHYFKRSEHQR